MSLHCRCFSVSASSTLCTLSQFYPWHFDVKATMAAQPLSPNSYGFHIPFTAFANDSNGSNSKWRKEIRIVRLLPAQREHYIYTFVASEARSERTVFYSVFGLTECTLVIFSRRSPFQPSTLFFHWIVCEIEWQRQTTHSSLFLNSNEQFVLLYNVMVNCGLWMCSGSFSFTTAWSFRSSQNDNHLQFKNIVDWMPNMQPYDGIVRLKKDGGAPWHTSSHTCRCVRRMRLRLFRWAQSFYCYCFWCILSQHSLSTRCHVFLHYTSISPKKTGRCEFVDRMVGVSPCRPTISNECASVY